MKHVKGVKKGEQEQLSRNLSSEALPSQLVKAFMDEISS